MAFQKDLISDETRMIFQWVLFTIICQAIDLFGIVANIINIMCFVSQGLKDPVNISLLGLTVSDMGCLLTLIWTNIFITPPLTAADLPFDALDFQYLTGSMPHVTFSRITCWMTAIVTLERCLCITAPLQVKSIVTPKLMSVVIIFLYLIILASVAPFYVVNKLDKKYSLTRNKTILCLVTTTNREDIERISFLINNIFSFIAFFIIISSTISIVIKLQTTSKWRRQTTSSVQGDNISNRNQRVAKMVVTISSLFIACFIPIGIMFIVLIMDTRLSFDGEYRNVSIVISGFGLILESLNSSVNIFIYYNMSSNYRKTFIHLFSRKNFCQTGIKYICGEIK